MYSNIYAISVFDLFLSFFLSFLQILVVMITIFATNFGLLEWTSFSGLEAKGSAFCSYILVSKTEFLNLRRHAADIIRLIRWILSFAAPFTMARVNVTTGNGDHEILLLDLVVRLFGQENLGRWDNLNS